MKKYFEFVNESKVKKHERIKLIDDDKYLLVVPLTDSASCKYGAFTGWCTAVPHSGASVENIGINKEDSNNKLIYLLQKQYNKDTSKADEFSSLYKDFENGEIEDEDMYYETIDNIDEEDRFDFSKIAFEYSPNYGYTIWDRNNLNLRNFGVYYLEQLDIDKYVIDKIKDYCEK